MATDVTDAPYQDELADGLLGIGPMAAPLVKPLEEASEYAQAGDTLVDEEIDSQANDVLKFGDTEAARRRGEQPRAEEDDGLSDSERATLSREERIMRGLERAAREAPVSQESGKKHGEQATKGSAAEQEQVQRTELSPREYKQAAGEMDAKIKELGLLENANQVAADLAPIFGAGALENAELLAVTIARLEGGARGNLIAAYESGAQNPEEPLNFASLPPVSRREAHDLTRAFDKFTGLNSQTSPAANELGFGNALYLGVANILHSAKMLDTTDPEEINNAEMCVRFYEALEMYRTGAVKPRDSQQDTVYRNKAVSFVNKLTKHLMDNEQKIASALQARQERAGKSQAAKSHMPRVTSAKKYDGIRTSTLRKEVREIGNGLPAETLAVYQREHGRL